MKYNALTSGSSQSGNSNAPPKRSLYESIVMDWTFGIIIVSNSSTQS